MPDTGKKETMTTPEHVAIILDGNGRWAKKRGFPRAMGHKEGCKTLEVMPDTGKKETMTTPEHVAIILDGNGRWAKKRGFPRAMGHKEGCKTLEDIVEQAARMGIRYLTVYGFSTENWKRSSEEVGALMQLFRYYMVRLLKIAGEHNVRVKMIGERNRFDSDIVEGINRLEKETKDNTGLTFAIAVNYGGRDEITRAAKKLAKDCAEGTVKLEEIDESFFASYLDTAGMPDPDLLGGRDEITRAAKKLAKDCAEGTVKLEEIDESFFASYLDTAGMPDPDLLIRTSGELRLSNYMLWQCAYTEIYVTDCLWPDFGKEELEKAIAAYNKRERRFGGR